jgi:hypothetical protein
MKGMRWILRAIVLTAAASGVAGCVATSGGAGSSTTSIGDLFHVTVTDSSNDGPTLLQDTIGNIARSKGGSITAGEEALAQKVLSETGDEHVMSWNNDTLGEVRMEPYNPEVREDGTVCRAYGLDYLQTGKIMGWVTRGGVACKDSSGTWHKT